MEKCGAKTLVYSRVVGYHNPIQNWNPGKVEEFKQRKVYKGGKLKTHGKRHNRTV